MPSLKAHVKLVCPGCGVDLTCFVKDMETSPSSWVLTDKSVSHLREAHK